MSGARDADGDSRMDSSSSSDSENMFPTEVESSTAGQGSLEHTRLSNVLGAEMSPPHSQDHWADINSPDGGAPGVAGTGGRPSKRTDAAKEKETKEPGWAWKNSKAREECERSLEHVLDRNFNMREFGELFEEKDIPGLGGMKK